MYLITYRNPANQVIHLAYNSNEPVSRGAALYRANQFGYTEFVSISEVQGMEARHEIVLNDAVDIRPITD